jgi:hypothetical protein
MHATLYEQDGFICLETPRGTFVFRNYIAHNCGYAMMEHARHAGAKESDDPDRHRRTHFVIHAIIDPDPETELGGTAPPDKERPACDREPGSGAGGGA